MQSFLNEALAGQRPVFAVCRRAVSPGRSLVYYTTRMQSRETRLVLFAEHEHARALAASLEHHYKHHGRFPSSSALELRTDAIFRDSWEELFTTVREVRLDEFVRQTHGSDVPMAIAYDVQWGASRALFKTCNLRMTAKPLDKVAFLEKRMAAEAVTGAPLNAGASATGPLGSIVPGLLLAKKPELPKSLKKAKTKSRQPLAQPPPPVHAALDHVWLLMLMLMRIVF